MRRFLLAWLVGAVLAPGFVAAGPCPDDRPCVGLVLAGGGARGAAHVGVLEVMERERVPVDFIIGTSMGAIIGGMYATGMSPQEMRRHLDAIDWEEAFNDHPPRRNIPFRQKEDDDRSLFKLEFGFGKDGFNSPRGLVAGQKLNFILSSLLLAQSSVADFDDLPIPFRAAAVDLENGELVILDDGDLATAIRASMAFPVFFTPVEVDGRLLVDGGVLRNMPVDVAIAMGADRLIAIDVGTPMGEIEDAASVFAVAKRTISVMSREGREAQVELIREQDLLIAPELDGISAFENFDDVGLAVERGIEAAERSIDALRSFSVDQATFARFLDRHRGETTDADAVIDRVVVKGLDRVSPKRVTGRVRSGSGRPLDLDVLQDDLQRVYQIGEFEEVGFEVRQEGEERILQIDATEKSWGPWFYRLGLSAGADFEGDGAFTLNVLLRRPNLNPLGGEWKTYVSIGSLDQIITDFYQPIAYSGNFFVAPRLFGSEDGDDSLFVEGVEVSFDSRVREMGLDLGFKLFNFGELRVGATRGDAEFRPRTDEAEFQKEDTGGWRLAFTLDGLDNANFPRSGTQVAFELFASRSGFNASSEYDRLFVSVGHAWRLGRWTQLATAAYGTDLGSELPDFDAFRLGGFFSISGLETGELSGSRMGLAQAAIYRKMFSLTNVIVEGDVYLGALLEAGNVWPEGQESEMAFSEAITSGALFAGVDTIIGPVYLGYGLAEGGKNAAYLFLGRVFGGNRISRSPRLGG